MTPKTAYISGMILIGGIAIAFTSVSAWMLVFWFGSGDLLEPFRQHATNFRIFSTFVLRLALCVMFLVGGLAIIRKTAFIAARDLKSRPSTVVDSSPQDR
jgi:hypothetical protein